jgi:hypothetical protein
VLVRKLDDVDDDGVARPHRQTLGRMGNDPVALVFDDLIDPFAARCLRVYGCAGEFVERVSELAGPGLFMRTTPTISWSWTSKANQPAPPGMRRGEPPTRQTTGTDRETGGTISQRRRVEVVRSDRG